MLLEALEVVIALGALCACEKAPVLHSDDIHLKRDAMILLGILGGSFPLAELGARDLESSATDIEDRSHYLDALDLGMHGMSRTSADEEPSADELAEVQFLC